MYSYYVVIDNAQEKTSPRYARYFTADENSNIMYDVCKLAEQNKTQIVGLTLYKFNSKKLWEDSYRKWRMCLKL